MTAINYIYTPHLFWWHCSLSESNLCVNILRGSHISIDSVLDVELLEIHFKLASYTVHGFVKEKQNL